MARFYWQQDPGVMMFEAEQGEELTLGQVQAISASDLAWAAKSIASSLQEIETQLDRIASKLPSEWA